MMNPTMEEALLFLQVPPTFMHTIMANLKPPADINLNRTQVRTLMMLKDHGPLTMHGLGNCVGMPKGSFTQVVDGLVQSSLVARQRDPGDRRTVIVSITEEGLKTTRSLDMNFRKHLTRILSGLEEADRNSLIEALRTIKKATQTIEERGQNATK